MEWEDRIDIADEEKEGSIDLAICFSVWRKGETKIQDDLLVEKLKGLPRSYILFLEKYDGLSIDSIVLYGEAIIGFHDIRKLVSRWEKYNELAPYFVIGEDAAGDPIAIKRSSGEIYLIEKPGLSSAVKLADDFDDFMGEVLFGPSYGRLYAGVTNVDTEWSRYLKSKRWLGQTTHENNQ